MSFSSFSEQEADHDLSEINMIPLIDVMLVLLIIFIIAAPLLTHAVKVELPKATSTPIAEKKENVQLSIDATGIVYWNDQAIDRNTLDVRLQETSKLEPQPELHLRAERTTPYEKVAEVMSAAARNGMSKIGFITEPEKQ